MKDGIETDNARPALFSAVLERLAKEMERVEKAAKGVEQESFRILSMYLKSILVFLEELRHKEVADPVAMHIALMELEQELEKAHHLIKKYGSKSKFYLVVKCQECLKEMEDIVHAIGHCLDAIPVVNVGLAVKTQEMITKLSSDMRTAQFKASISEEAILVEIADGVRDGQNNYEYANDLLLQLGQAAGVSTDPTCLKSELDKLKRDKEDAGAQGNQEEFWLLEQIVDILIRTDAATSTIEKGVNYQKKRGSGRWDDPLLPLQSFYCPITHEIMEEPVEIASGQIFERSAIEKWFSAGNANCPTTKIELENLQIKLNLALKQSIQEWKERNIVISIAATKTKLQSSDESEICSSLRTLLALSEEKSIHRHWISLEGLIPCLVSLLKSHQRTVRKGTLEVLRSLSVDNAENKKQIAVAGAIKLVVKSLARDVGEGRQAVALLRELSKNSEICDEIGKVQGCILLLVFMLNAENPHSVGDAKKLLHDLADSDQNIVQMAEANYFEPLTQRLNEGPVTQGHLLRAFLGMSSIPNATEVRNKLREGGAIQLILPLCEFTADNVRLHTLQLLKCLTSEGAGDDLADHLWSTYIKALVNLLLDSSKDDERMAAVGIICNFPTNNTHLTDLLLQADALPAILNLLLPTKGTKMGSWANRSAMTESAAGVLLRFTSPVNSNAISLQQKAADLDAISCLVQLLQTGTPVVKCRAATALSHFSRNSDRLASKVVASRSCCLRPWFNSHTSTRCSIHEGLCSVKTNFCLVMANAVGPLVQALEEQEQGADEAALNALNTLLVDDTHLESAIKVIAEAQGIRNIVRLLTAGSVGAKERAVMMLEKIFRIEEYKVEFGSTAQMPLIALTQTGSIATRPVAAKILAHLNILHNQSSYF